METNKSLVVVDYPSDGKVLPEAFEHYFLSKNETPDFCVAVAQLYTGSKRKPTHAEFLEAFSQYRLFEASDRHNKRSGLLSTQVDLAQKRLAEGKILHTKEEITDKELKYLEKRVDIQRSILERSENSWLNVQRELGKAYSEQLRREAPKSVLVNHSNISISSYQNMLRGIDENKVVDAEFEEVDMDDK